MTKETKNIKRNDMKRFLFAIAAMGILTTAAAQNASVVESRDIPVSQYAARMAPLKDYLPPTTVTGDIRVDIINYPTQTPDGSQVIASGIVTYPADGILKGVVVAPHATILNDSDAPSNNVFSNETSQLATYGYMVVTPDYIGYGATANLPHPYLDVENTGRVTVDMLFAVRELMDAKGVETGDSVIVVGYSQGASAALAFDKMAEERYDDEIKVKRTFVGGGPYDPLLTFGILSKSTHTEHPSLIPLSILGVGYGAGIKADPADVFVGKLKDNYKDWILSKKYTLEQVDSLIGTKEISQIVDMNVINSSEFSDLFAKALAANSLVGWVPKAPIYMFHAQDDTYVPIENSIALIESFKKSNFTSYTFKTAPGDHITPLFIIDVINILARDSSE